MADRQWLEEQITLNWAPWAKQDPRYTKLALLDTYLDGKQYECLNYSFDKEEDNGKYIPIYQRRPSATYNIPGMVARQLSRKLFAGKHAPRLVHKDEELRDKVQKLLEESELPKLMPTVARKGSVGSVVVLFKIAGDGKIGKILSSVVESKWCRPRFDRFRELEFLRICYPSAGAAFIFAGYTADWKGEKIDPKVNYWKITDIDRETEKTYLPMPESEWSPLEPEMDVKLKQDGDEIKHGLGVVPAHWFVNQADGSFPDGASTFEDAIPNVLSLDYAISQLFRAVNYCGSPQVVIVGDLVGQDEDDPIYRSPALTLQLKGKEQAGDVITGGGEAKLLEMTGQGISVGIKLCEKVRMWALEQIGCARPDKNEVGNVVTGKAMELFDEDIVDVLGELRTAYGDYGYLPLVKKMATAAIKANHPLMVGVDPTQIDGFSLAWPKTFSLTPQEGQQIAQTAQIAKEAEIWDSKKADAYMEMHLDLPVFSENRNHQAEVTIDRNGDGVDDENEEGNRDMVAPPS